MDIINIIGQYGIEIAIILWFMFVSSKQMNEIKKVISDNTLVLRELCLKLGAE